MTQKEELKLKHLIKKAMANGYKPEKQGDVFEMEGLIFNITKDFKPFLKALFNKNQDTYNSFKEMLSWEYHAKQLVLEDNKIEYLYKHI